MSVKITYFVHGTTIDNENHIATGWNYGELSKLGIQQAQELSDLVPWQQYDVMFSSDLKRAVDSAELGFKNKIPIIQDERLRECNYGDFNGTKHEKGIKQQHISKPFPNGESYQQVADRIKLFLDDIKMQYPGQHVAIMAHHAPQLALEVLLNNKTWEQAFAEDRRKTKSWRPGWEYKLE